MPAQGIASMFEGKDDDNEVRDGVLPNIKNGEILKSTSLNAPLKEIVPVLFVPEPSKSA
mgnify:CR=1 FL=1